MNAHAKFLLSGLAPGSTGTGRFLEALIPYAREAGYEIIHPPEGVRFGPSEHAQLSPINDADVIILHPQTLGFGLVLNLARNNNRVALFVLDNSFFCMQSYNHRPDQRGECLDCLTNTSNCSPNCKPFPVKYSRDENIQFLQELSQLASKIRFFCQTETQKQLVLQHFPSVFEANVIGMRTEEFQPLPEHVEQPAKSFDIVFHAEAVHAKGADYALRLAYFLGDHSILFPFPREELNIQMSDTPVPANAYFENMRWQTGLMNQVVHSKLVLCPSMWSAPVEGALMKSLFYNGNVAVYNGVYHFQKEIPDHIIHRLGPHIIESAKYLKKEIDRSPAQRLAARQWVLDFIQKVDFSLIFT
ncbi:hypothetical protein OAO01_07185 [Oligoflexia bacterium]|nr:hypothetical protein [Oligoflexia bacterium]